MSGFIAIVNLDGSPIDRDLLEHLTNSMRVRGPDRQQVWINGSVGFGHTLLRTTDEAQYDRQPATLSGAVWITGSARIDDRERLVDELRLTDKIRLDQTPDSDLILHAYQAWGEHCPEHLLGDFAFAIWDERDKKLFCARDRFGVRQLYYARTRNSLIVTNTLHCMVQYPGISRRLNEKAIGDFLLFGDHTWGDKTQTAFADIWKLHPAHSLVLVDGSLRTQRYWDFPLDVPLLRYRKEQDYLDHFNEVFRTAVADRLRTPQVVIALSGGMDSTSIAATVRDIQDRSNREMTLNSISIRYDSIHPSDEYLYTESASKQLDLSTKYIDGGQYPLLSPSLPRTRPLEVYQPALWHKMECLGGQMASVMLNGEAGDNLLSFSPTAGSGREMNPVKLFANVVRMRMRYGTTPGIGLGIQRFLSRAGKNGEDEISAPYPYPTWLDPDFEKRLGLQDNWADWLSMQPGQFNTRHPQIHRALTEPEWCDEDTYWLNDSVLPEKRDPFLDLRTVRFVLSLPVLPWLFRKHLLRQAMVGKLPTQVIRRPKVALGMIHDSLLKQPEAAWVDSWQPISELSQFVDRSKIPQVNGGACDPISSYVHLRPLILDDWLKNQLA